MDELERARAEAIGRSEANASANAAQLASDVRLIQQYADAHHADWVRVVSILVNLGQRQYTFQREPRYRFLRKTVYEWVIQHWPGRPPVVLDFLDDAYDQMARLRVDVEGDPWSPAHIRYGILVSGRLGPPFKVFLNGGYIFVTVSPD